MTASNLRRDRDVGSPTDWPMVGRQSEVDYLLRVIGDTAAGVVISGDIGVGKTCLAAAVTERLAAQGWSVTRHVATAARATIPFAPFATLLDATSTLADPLQRLAEATARLAGRRDGPLALHVDDAQWLDDESWAFLHHVTETAGASLLLTARGTDPGMPRVVAASRSMGLSRLELLPLSRVEMTELLRLAAPELSVTDRHQLWKLTQGNPLYLREAVARTRERGSTDAVRFLDGVHLDAVVDARLEDLLPAQRHVLELVTVGGLAPVDLLRAHSSDEELADLEQRHLMVIEEAGRRLVARLAHPIYGEVVVARMGVAAQRARRRELLEHLAGRKSQRQSDLVQIAVWSLEQGEAVDPAVLLSVARRLAGYSHESSPGAGDPLPPLPGGLLDLAARLARAATDAGAGFEAADCWFRTEAHVDGNSAATAEALARMRALATTEEQQMVTATAAAGLHALNGWETPAEVLAGLEDVQQGTTGSVRRSADALMAMTMSAFGRYQEAADLGRRVLDDPATTPRDRLVVVAPVIGSLAVLGHLVEALALSDRSMTEIPPDADQWSLGSLVFVRVLVLRANGRLRDAEDLATAVVASAEATGNHLGVGLFGLALAETAMTAGRPGDVLAATAAAIASGTDDDDGPSDRRMAHAYAAQAHALLGNREAAAIAMERAEQGPLRTHIFRVLHARARAWVKEAEGHHRAAATLLRDTARDDPDNRLGAMACWHDLTRLGEHGSGAEMQALIDRGVDGDLWAACTAHAVAFDAGDGALLDAASAQLAALGVTLPAAEASAQASCAHDAAGDRRAAAASRADSAKLAEECQGARTPALAMVAGSFRLLTPREMEVARLAARGASNRQIADDVALSVRTVETYLYRIYFKLGITDRKELADHLDR